MGGDAVVRRSGIGEQELTGEAARVAIVEYRRTLRKRYPVLLAAALSVGEAGEGEAR